MDSIELGDGAAGGAQAQEWRLGEDGIQALAADVADHDHAAGARHLGAGEEEHALRDVLAQEGAVLLDRAVDFVDRLQVVEVEDVDGRPPTRP